MLVDLLLKTKKEFKNSKKQEIQLYLQNEFEKACFQHDMLYQDFEDLARNTASDNFLRDKALVLQKILTMMDIKEDWLLQYTNFLIKNLLQVVGSLIIILNKICNLRKNYMNQLLETLKKEQYILEPKTIFGT